MTEPVTYREPVRVPRLCVGITDAGYMGDVLFQDACVRAALPDCEYCFQCFEELDERAFGRREPVSLGRVVGWTIGGIIALGIIVFCATSS